MIIGCILESAFNLTIVPFENNSIPGLPVSSASEARVGPPIAHAKIETATIFCRIIIFDLLFVLHSLIRFDLPELCFDQKYATNIIPIFGHLAPRTFDGRPAYFKRQKPDKILAAV
jgi:hypothetical protein